jgi:hypothetical protein
VTQTAESDQQLQLIKASTTGNNLLFGNSCDLASAAYRNQTYASNTSVNSPNQQDGVLDDVIFS